ncbi:hypothetical protein CCUS01_15997 [Colletotrichum cuscutae]|uniref:Uncharacterized protein n=1 Tax=Colletotrichum cuscutae TaxID=1209917 RepID=A0AAI9Y766_9PEZI|nr:hypothetical protein CCUS01_15997 [Colletotrichum cuscutae]
MRKISVAPTASPGPRIAPQRRCLRILVVSIPHIPEPDIRSNEDARPQLPQFPSLRSFVERWEDRRCPRCALTFAPIAIQTSTAGRREATCPGEPGRPTQQIGYRLRVAPRRRFKYRNGVGRYTVNIRCWEETR